MTKADGEAYVEKPCWRYYFVDSFKVLAVDDLRNARREGVIRGWNGDLETSCL